MARNGSSVSGPGSAFLYGPGRRSLSPPDYPRFPHMGVTDPDEIFACPYDAHHLVRACRYPYHLVKCRENNRLVAREMKTCPFNACHILPKPEMQHHISCCRDKRIIEQDIAYESTRDEVQKEIDLKGNSETLLTSENWDEELQEESAFILGQPHFTTFGNFSNLNICMRRIYKRQLKEQICQEYRHAPRLPSTLPKVWGEAQKLKENAFSMGRGKKLVQLAASFSKNPCSTDRKPAVGARTASTNRGGMGRGRSTLGETIPG
uniref:gametocyte-specific factor 1-like isoform X2 n=1 Tax=Myxine glutinosa TaxID=7769 RepID=UPI00358E1D5D